jgi:hypothetical protein
VDPVVRKAGVPTPLGFVRVLQAEDIPVPLDGTVNVGHGESDVVETFEFEWHASLP